VDSDVDVTYDIRGVPVSILTVDLNAPNLAGMDRLTERIGELAKYTRTLPH
jgi:hypothetical protein